MPLLLDENGIGLQVLKIYHLDTEAVLYSTQLSCADVIHKLSW